jgi:hypothetical protein
MPIINGLTFSQNSDIASGVVTDTSDYAVGGNPPRSAKANYLLWSKTDSDGNRVFTNPDPGDVFSTLIYNVATFVDGYHEGILVRVAPYAPATPYVEEQSAGGVITQYASIVFDGGAVYKCIVPVTDVAPTDPTGADYWAVVSDLSTLLDNVNVEVFIEEFYIKIRSMRCAAAQFNSCGCGCSDDLDKIRTPLLIASKLMAADSEVANGNFTEMQAIIEDITQTCSTCGS